MTESQQDKRKPITSLVTFVKTWTLPIAIVAGALSYFFYTAIPSLAPYKNLTLNIISIVQPVLLFLMLFVAFCKVEPSHIRPHLWHLWHLLIQSSIFCLLGLVLLICPDIPGAVCIEGTMICFICPTATAAAIITHKLGGSIEEVVTYTIFINLLAAFLIPAIVPLIHPHPGLDFTHSFWMIMGRVFPMLICPFFAAILVRYAFPAFHQRVLSTRDLAFYMWVISLALAIAVSTKSAMHAHTSMWNIAGLAAGSFIACALQFYLGRVIGRHYGCSISSSQALGQKATVFAIWAAYTFMTPLASLAGGFYSIWHNLWNTYQLRQAMQQQDKSLMSSNH